MSNEVTAGETLARLILGDKPAAAEGAATREQSAPTSEGGDVIAGFAREITEARQRRASDAADAGNVFADLARGPETAAPASDDDADELKD